MFPITEFMMADMIFYYVLMSGNIKFNWIFKLGCVSMTSLIALGAAYGHKGKLDEDGTVYFNKAQMYHLMNSNHRIIADFGLFCSCLVAPATLPFKIAVGGFIMGILAFVGPLYYMAIKGRNNSLSKTMPVGGIAMMAGWVSLIFA